MVKWRVVGGEGLANFERDYVSLECQLCVTCEPVECWPVTVDDEFCSLGGIKVEPV